MTLLENIRDDEHLVIHLRRNSYRSVARKLLYVATPKAACTSIKWWFAAMEGISARMLAEVESSESAPELIIHDTLHKVAPDITGLELEDLAEALKSDDYFRFALVRNPYKRIFSAWQSKILLREPLQGKTYADCNFYTQSIRSVNDVIEAFEAFLEHLHDSEYPDFRDEHWRTQLKVLRPDLIEYSMISQIEATETLEKTLAARLGPGIGTPFAMRRTNESLIPYTSEFITNKAATLIQALYRDDFAAFGYSTEIPKGGRKLSDQEMAMALTAIEMIRGRHQRLDEIRSAYRARYKASEASLVDARAEIASLRQALVDRDKQIDALCKHL